MNITARTRRTALEIAATSIFETRAMHETVDQMMTVRSVTHHWHGLYAYAALRVGPEAARNILNQLANEQSDKPELGPRRGAPSVTLYRRLRELVAAEATQGSGGSSVSFELSFRTEDDLQDRVLFRIREALSGECAEAVELHFARGLSMEDVAQVMALPQETVRDRLEAAAEAARRICSDSSAMGPRFALSKLFAEAYALDPRAASSPPRPVPQRVLELGAKVAGRYEIEALLGAGAFADVYRARDCDVEGHTVALKIARSQSLSERSVRAALRELQLLASVFHPSVVQLKDHGWHEGHLWFVMPLYRGETLASRLKRGPLSRGEARSVFAPLAEALATMHQAGVLHQDIKPENIFLAELDPNDGRAAELDQASQRVLPVLLDLGVAAKDAEVVLAGTPAYLAPEVAARFAGLPDPAPIGPKADVFSLALTLRDALSAEGRQKSPSASTDTFVSQRAHRAPMAPRDPELRDLRALFQRWLHVSPDERPSAAEFQRDLRMLTAPTERAERRVATLRWAVPTAVALSCIFGIVVYSLSQQARTKEMEATRARDDAARASQRAESIHADLEMQQARRKELEGSMERLERDYRESKLSREELAARLAQVEGDATLTQDKLTSQRERGAALEKALVDSQMRERQLQQSVDATRKALARETRRLEQERERLQVMREEALATQALQDRLEQRLEDLEESLERTRPRSPEKRSGWTLPTTGKSALSPTAKISRP